MIGYAKSLTDYIVLAFMLSSNCVPKEIASRNLVLVT